MHPIARPAVAVGALVLLTSGCQSTPASDRDASEGPSATSDPSPPTATFRRGGISFQYPASWDVNVLAEGKRAGSGCTEESWIVVARGTGQGLTGVSRCPSSFDWPTRANQAIPAALREELTVRYPHDSHAFRNLESGEMAGLPGVHAAVSLDPSAARQFGVAGPADVRLYRAADSTSGSNQDRPDIYEVVCAAPVGDADGIFAVCDAIVDSFAVA